MAGARNNLWFCFEFWLKHRLTGAVKVFRLTDRFFYSARGPYYLPLVTGFSGVGITAGDDLPRDLQANIEINNQFNTLAANKRFCDLIDQYEMISQPVAVYAAKTAHNESPDNCLIPYEAAGVGFFANTGIEDTQENYDAGPDGEINALMVQCSTANSAHKRVNTYASGQAGRKYRITAKLKSLDTTNAKYIWLGDTGDASNHGAVIDLSDEIVPSQSGATATRTELGDGWALLQVDFTRTNAGNISTTLAIQNTYASSGPESYVGTTNKMFLVRDVQLYELDIEGQSGEFFEIWRGRVAQCSIRPSSNEPTMSVQVVRSDIPVRNITRIITADAFTDAPTRSVGQPLPVIVGSEVQVRPLPISDDTARQVDWAYATTFGTRFYPKEVTKLYAPDFRGNMIEITSAAAKTTNITTLNRSLNATVTNGTWETNEKSRAHAFQVANNYLCPGLRLFFQASSGTRDGSFRLQLFENRNTYWTSLTNSKGVLMFDEIASAEIQYSDLAINSNVNSIAVYAGDFKFNKPVPLRKSGDGYYYVWVLTRDAGTDNITLIEDSGNTAAKYWAWHNGTNWALQNAGNQALYFEVYAFTFDLTTGIAPTSDMVDAESGLGYSYFTSEHHDDFDCDVDTLKLVAECEGLADDTSGTLTGSSRTLIENTMSIIRVVCGDYADQTWNIDKITNDEWFATNHSYAFEVDGGGDLNVYRKLSGATKGRTQLKNFLREAMRNSGSRMLSVNGYGRNLAVYPYGKPETEVAEIDDEDLLIDQVKVLNLKTAVNRVIMQLAPKLTIGDVADLVQGNIANNYSDTVDSNLLALSIAERSQLEKSLALFGELQLSSSGYSFVRNDDVDSAEIIARMLLAVYPYPHVYVVGVLPYAKYSFLNIMDVVGITHPDVFSYQGTSKTSSTYSYDGTLTDLLGSGEYAKAAKRYRAQIESLEISKRKKEAAQLQISARLLISETEVT